MDILDILLSASFWTAAIRIASPLIFATLGELICERAGVLNFERRLTASIEILPLRERARACVGGDHLRDLLWKLRQRRHGLQEQKALKTFHFGCW